MGIIYNITFFVGKEREAELLTMLRGDFKKVATATDGVTFLHLTRVIGSAGAGMMEGEQQAVSLGMQFSFPDVHAFEDWRAGALREAFGLVTSRFGEEVLHFDTVLEVME